MSDMAIDLPARRFTVAEYHRIADAGIFSGERVELLDGTIVPMSPIGERHWRAHGLIARYLGETFGRAVFVVGQGSFPLGPRNEPEPDIAILDPRWALEPPAGSPAPDDLWALVEIADTSAGRDLVVKARLYGRFGIVDYLVVDLAAGELVQHREPYADGYRDVRRRRSGERFTLTRLPHIVLEAAEFLRA